MRTLRSRSSGALLVAVALLAGACQRAGDEAAEPGQPQERTLTVGAGEASESQIVAQMYIRVLEDAGYEVDNDLGYGSPTDLLAALEEGTVDAAPLYLASLARELDPQAQPSGDPLEVAGFVRPFLEERGLTVLDPSPANSGEALVVSSETAEEHGLQTVSDLASIAGRLTLGAPSACEEAPTCLPGLRDVYGIEFGGFEAVDDPSEALEAGKVDVAFLPATSARIREERWVVLQDGRRLQPAENVTPVVRRDVLNQEIPQLLNAVSASLSLGHLTLYNRSFEFGESPGTLAILHLNNARLLGGATGASPAPIPEAPPASCEDVREARTAQVTAEGSAFSAGCLIVSPDQPIEFANEDQATPHTFTISLDTSFRPPYLLDLDDPLGGQTMKSSGVGDAVEPGGWPFFCRYHAYMNGQIWVE